MRKSQWAYLVAVQHCCLVGAQGEEGRAPREASHWTQAKGAPWPGRSMAACSPAGERARRRGGRRWRRGPARSRRRLLFVGLVRLREQKGEGKWELGFRPSRPGHFDRPEWPLSRRSSADGGDCAGGIATQAGCAAAALCRPRPTLRPGWQRAREWQAGLRGELGRASFCRFWAQRGRMSLQFPFLFL